ncbi:MAG: lysoplasmalogenase [Bacteroidota bacterium]|nr:lysoplasmalogenase [Bacteroidota bacterium]MDP4197424.1 lysoplasmalogenase [Bacteroidota bacterium]
MMNQLDLHNLSTDIKHKGSDLLAKTNKIFYSLFFIFFIAYVSTLNYRPYPLSYLVKIIPIFSLTAVAYFNIEVKKRKFIVAALLFSAAGDFFLALSGKGYFIYGLSCFAFAHIMYISAFMRRVELYTQRSLLILPFLLYGIFIGYFLFPRVGGLLIPVSIYFCLLFMMGISTILGKENHYIMIPGAFLFIVSDSIIAINTFINKVPNSSFWIMITYFPAQLLLIYGASKKYLKSSIK